MEVWMFFFGVPILAGTLQFLVTRSRMPRRLKWSPAIAASLLSLLCFLAVIDWIALPETYWLDGGSFLAFPDYFYVWLFCFPVLFGLGMGAFFAAATRPGQKGP